MSEPCVEALTTRRVLRPLSFPFRTALREVVELEVIELELAVAGGGRGRAEVVPTPPITGETAGSIEAALNGPLAAAVAGCPLDVHELARRARHSLVGNPTAKCALDLAAHDVLAELAGRSLPGLLGSTRLEVATDATVDLDAPEQMAAAARRRAAEGYRTIKVKLGGGAEVDRRRLSAVVGALADRPEIRLRLDANQGWSELEALELLEGWHGAGLRLELVEQPVRAPGLAAMARVAARSPYPLLADESVHDAAGVLRIAETGAAALVNVKLAKCGGLLAAAEMIATARACGLGVIVGSMLEPARTLAAAVALAGALAPESVHDLDACLWTGGGGLLAYDPPSVRLGAPATAA